MTTKSIIVLLASMAAPILLPPDLAAQQRCPEATSEFDFYVGDWRVRQEIRSRDSDWIELPARSVVRPVAGGCAYFERWSGPVQFFWEGMEQPEPLEGISVRAYDEEAGQWQIWWLDSHDPDFGGPFVGGFEDGVGTFLRTSTSADGRELLGRIRFMDVTPESIEWDLSVSRDGGQSWLPLWLMHFSREAESGGQTGAAPDS